MMCVCVELCDFESDDFSDFFNVLSYSFKVKTAEYSINLIAVLKSLVSLRCDMLACCRHGYCDVLNKKNCFCVIMFI